MRDSEVVASIVAGDPNGLATAYDRYADSLYKYCRSMLSDPAEAADAVQDTFVIAASRLDQLRDPDRLRAWLYAVARSECLRILRSVNDTSALDHAPDMTDTAVDVAKDAERAELRTLLREAAAGLNPGEREVIELQLRQGLATAEVASVLGVSRNHAHSLSSRARDQLEACLGVLLVGRTGRADCRELSSLLAGWDGRLTALLRKRVHRHIEHCATCTSRREFELRPATLLDLSPGAAMASATAESFRLAAGAPGGLKAHTLALATGRGPAAAAHRAAVLSRAGTFAGHGFPKAAAYRGAAKAGGGAGGHHGVASAATEALRTPRGQAATTAALVLAVIAAVAAFALSGNTEHFTPAAAEPPATAATSKAPGPSSPPPTLATRSTTPSPSRSTPSRAPAATTSSPTPTKPSSAPTSASPSPTATPGSLSESPPGGTAKQPAQLSVLPGSQGTSISLRASGSGSGWRVNWSVTVTGDPGGVFSVSPPSDSLDPSHPTVTVTIQASAYLQCGWKREPACPTVTISPSGAVFTVWTGKGHQGHGAGSLASASQASASQASTSQASTSLASAAEPVPVSLVFAEGEQVTAVLGGRRAGPAYD